MTDYIPSSQDDHGRDEELQWGRVVASGDAARGVALIFLQKFCTAFHEFEPACRSGVLTPDALPHFQARLSGRARRLLQVLETNHLNEVEGAMRLRELVSHIETAKSLEALALLAEPVHALSHILSEGLETE